MKVEVDTQYRVGDGTKFTAEISIHEDYDPIWDTWCRIEFIRFIFNCKKKTLTVMDFDRYDGRPQWKMVFDISLITNNTYKDFVVSLISNRTENLIDASKFLDMSLEEYSKLKQNL